MNQIAHVLTACLAAAAVLADGSGHREALRLAVGTNGVAAAKAALAVIDWQGMRDPVAEIRALKGLVEGRAGFGGLVRELDTKLRLLTPGARMDGSDGTMAVPVAEAPVVAVVPVPIPHLRVVCVSAEDLDFPAILLPGEFSLRIPVAWGAGLYMPVAFAERIPMTVVSSRSAIADGLEGSYGAFVSERDIWARRYGKLRRFLNADGTEFSPDWGTALYRLRQEVESGPDRYDVLIDAYNERVGRLQWRKKMLREVR